MTIVIGPIDGFTFHWNQSHLVDVRADDPALDGVDLDCFSVGDYEAGSPSLQQVIDDCHEWNPDDRLDPDLYGHLVPRDRRRLEEDDEL